jgi:hypothetical protein
MSGYSDRSRGVEEEFPGTTKAVAAVMDGPVVMEGPTDNVQGPDDVLDLDNVLAYTQKVRLGASKVINGALKQGVDSEMVNALLKAASDMDKGVLNRRRVGIEEEAAKTAEESQRDSASLLRAIGSKMFQLDPTQIDPNRKPPSLGDDVAAPVLVPGQTDQGTQQLSYDAFAKDVVPPQ